MSKLTRSLFVSLFALCIGSLMMMPAPPAKAQSVSVGADVVNRYIWRGQVLSTGASVQPSLSFSQSGFTIGSWGSFSTAGPSAGAGGDELDLYASYSFDLGANGSFSVGVTDYFFPDQSNGPPANSGFFDYDTDELDRSVSGHVIEPNVSYTGPESLPISLYGAINAWGTAGNEVWLEASYPFSVSGVDLSVAVGGALNDTDESEDVNGDGTIGELTGPDGEVVLDEEAGDFYGTDNDTAAGIMKLSISASKEIKITDDFSLPVFGSYYLNPYHEIPYFVFGISL
jgi:hypothetical protein